MRHTAILSLLCGLFKPLGEVSLRRGKSDSREGRIVSMPGRTILVNRATEITTESLVDGTASKTDRLVADQAENFPDVCDAVIGEVHRDLNHATVGKLEAERFDVRQTAGRGANGFRDILGDLQVGGLEIDVVGDQRDAGTDGGRAGAGVDRGRTLVRDPVGIADVAEQVLVATAPNLLQLAALRSTGGLAVVVDGDLQLFPEPRPERMG